MYCLSLLKKMFLSLVLLVGAAPAQSILSAQYPLGLKMFVGSGSSASMGGTGIGTIMDQNTHLLNPANLGYVKRNVFSGFFDLSLTRIADNSTSSYFSSFTPNQISFAFNANAFGVLSMGLIQDADATIKFQNRSPFYYAGLSDSLEMSFIRNGGMTSWQVGWGYNVLKKVAIGLSYSYKYINLTDSRRQILYGPGGIKSSRDSVSAIGSMNVLRGGIMAPVGPIVAGLTLEYPFEAQIDKVHGFYSNGNSNDVEASQATIKLAPSGGFGLSYSPNSQWLYALDYSMILCDHYLSGGVLGSTEVNNTHSFSAGAQFVPAQNVLAPKYWETIAYRAGIRYAQLPAKENSELGLTIGGGLPLGSDGLLDIILGYTNRSGGASVSFKEQVFSVSVGISGGKKWSKSSRDSY